MMHFASFVVLVLVEVAGWFGMEKDSGNQASSIQKKNFITLVHKLNKTIREGSFSNEIINNFS